MTCGESWLTYPRFNLRLGRSKEENLKFWKFPDFALDMHLAVTDF